jgi:hypothetical protein
VIDDNSKDNFSAILLNILDASLLYNASRTIIGICIGACLQGFYPILVSLVETNIEFKMPNVPWVSWYGMGVITTLIRSSPINPKLPQDIEILLSLLEKGKEFGLKDWELRQRYRNVLQKYSDNVGLNQDTYERIEKIKIYINEAESNVTINSQENEI